MINAYLLEARNKEQEKEQEQQAKSQAKAKNHKRKSPKRSLSVLTAHCTFVDS